MSFAERLKELRKHFGITQEEFANRINVKQNTVANYETSRREAMGPTLSLICREFNVREEWLRDGVGDMFAPEPDYFSLDDFAKKRNMTELEKDILIGYLQLDEHNRKIAMDMILEIAAKHNSKKDEDDIDAKVAAYRAELEAQKKAAAESEVSQNIETA